MTLSPFQVALLGTVAFLFLIGAFGRCAGLECDGDGCYRTDTEEVEPWP